jgi:hypothetical protein
LSRPILPVRLMARFGMDELVWNHIRNVAPTKTPYLRLRGV